MSRRGNVRPVVAMTTTTTTMTKVALLLAVLCLSSFPDVCYGRPVVRNIRSTHEFERLLEKHSSETGLPVIVDYYSDSCGPCRMMAPIFKKVAAEYRDKAVFVKVDTNAQPELSSRHQIRSLPTFHFFVGGSKFHQAVGGIGEGGLRQETDRAVRQADAENVVLSSESLAEYYAKVDPSKSESDISAVHGKCVDMTPSEKKKRRRSGGDGECVGAAANQLSRRLRKKYGSSPKTKPRFTAEDRKGNKGADKGEGSDGGSAGRPSSSGRRAPSSSSSGGGGDRLRAASKEELMAELERRLDEERDEQVEEESEDEDEADPELSRRWTPSPSFPERVVIVGGGPAGMSAAIYASRAGLAPLVLAPSMGGQLQGKGVDVENYPGLFNMTGSGVISAMRRQAAHFGAYFEDDVVTGILVPDDGAAGGTIKPLRVVTNSTGTIETHAVIVATGAESNWLGVPGEYDMRGAGVSSCAVCDGFLYSDGDVVVVGGGDSAMEEALLLARTSRSVTVVHRRDSFRASKVLADRVLSHPSIAVVWNTTVQEIVGTAAPSDDAGRDGDDDDEDVVQDLDNEEEATTKLVSAVRLRSTNTGEERRLRCDAVFVAIGHKPSTSFLRGVVEFDPYHTGYVTTYNGTTHTSRRGIFAAGDVTDPVYRQAITSAGSGAAAALDVERYLSEHGLGNEEAEFEAELMAELMGDDSSSSSSGRYADSYNAYDDAGGRMEGMRESVTGGEL